MQIERAATNSKACVGSNNGAWPAVGPLLDSFGLWIETILAYCANAVAEGGGCCVI